MMEKFGQLSTDIFKYLVTDYNYNLIEVKKSSISIKNTSIEILIYLEYSNVFLKIRHDDEDYDFGILHLLIFQRKIQTFDGAIDTDSKITLQLANYAIQLFNFFKHPTFNNFEWVYLYKEFYLNLKYIQTKMGKTFTFSHPIYLKFINGDISWKEDLK